jgi:hypothetical protein
MHRHEAAELVMSASAENAQCGRGQAASLAKLKGA